MKAQATVQKSQIPLNGPARRYTEFFIGSRQFTHRDVANSVTFQFTDQHKAQAFFDLLVEILPLLNTEYPKINNKEVLLSDEQYLFYRRQVMNETGYLTTDYLEESLLKTLRADELDYSYAFILGVIPGENNNRRHQNLRPKARQQYTITPERTITPRTQKKPMFTEEQKRGFSQVQSCTLIDPYALSTAFGFNKGNRVNKLYGLMTHIDDALINRMLIEDCGTIARPFDCQSMHAAEIQLNHLKNDNITRCYSAAELSEFKAANIKTRQSSNSTNEVLARLRFNPYRSVVCICADTLEARLLAHDFSRELLEHYAIYAESTGQKLNPHFKIPIIFYVPKLSETVTNSKRSKPRQSDAKHVLRFYTEDMFKKDQAEAVEIVKDAARRTEHYRNHNYEFLLGLPEITQEILFENHTDCSLALHMMKAGYVRMLLRLLRYTYGEPSLRDAALDAFTATLSPSLKPYDPVIAKLILLEAFDLADKLLAATNTKKYLLGYPTVPAGFCGESLTHHLILNGNPRQINYVGLEDMLVQAAKNGSWVTIRLCLKEYPDSNTFILKVISSSRLNNTDFEESSLLIPKVSLPAGNGNSLITIAAKIHNWLVVSLIINNPNIVVDKAAYGYVLMLAISDKQEALALLLLQAGAEPTWRHSYSGYHLRSSLYEAVNHNFVGLLPLLIKHENQSQDEYAQYRYLLALDHAYKTGNKEAIVLLEANWNTDTAIHASNAKKCICIVVLYTLSGKNRSLAEKRLFEYCHQFKLLPQNNNNIIDAIRMIMPHFVDTINKMDRLDFEYIIKYLVEIFLFGKELDLFNFIANPKTYQDVFHNILVKDYIFCALASHLTLDNVERINDIVNHIFNHQKSIENNTEQHADKKKWGLALLHELEKTFHDAGIDEERAFFLLRVLGFNFQGCPPCSETDKRLFFKGKKITIYNIDSLQVSIETKRDFLSILIKNQAHFDTFYSLVVDSITPHHLSLFVFEKESYDKEDRLILLLRGISHTKYRNWFWDFYKVLTFGAFRLNFKVEEELIRISSPSVIRHIVLIFLLHQFALHVKITYDRDKRPNIRRTLENTWELPGYLPSERYAHVKTNDIFNKMHTRILSIFEEYFSDVRCKMPEEPVILDTFTKILGLLETSVKSHPIAIRFFESMKPQGPEFNRRLYLYMQRINQELAKTEIEHQSDFTNSHV